jgi:hypothetical protein
MVVRKNKNDIGTLLSRRNGANSGQEHYGEQIPFQLIHRFRLQQTGKE